MKTLLLTLGMAAALVGSSYAVEYITLFSGEETTVSPESLVEAVGSHTAYFGLETQLFFDRAAHPETGETSVAVSGAFPATKGLLRIKNITRGVSWITFKITHANELNAVAPTSVLVIPENSTGNYNIVVETSSDMATWTPFHSQTVSAADAKRFFRTRIVKAE